MSKGIIKDKNGRWYIHTTIKGKSITIRGFDSFKQANENYDYAIRKWQEKHGFAVYESEYTAVVKEYLDYRSKIVRAESLRKDITQLKYFNILFESDKIGNIFNKNRLTIIYNNILNSEFSPAKQSRLVLAFREFAKYCLQTNRVNESAYNEFLLVFVPIKVNKQDTKAKRYIPISDFKALLSEINKVNDYLFALAVSVLYFAGLRISELLGLLGSDIDLENKKINIKRQLLTTGKLTTTLKTSNSYRRVPITTDLFKMFELIRLSDKRLFDYSHTNFKRKLRLYETHAHINTYSAHEFRHTFCSRLAEQITNISEVSYCAKISGHTTSVFLNTYVKSLDSELEQKFF